MQPQDNQPHAANPHDYEFILNPPKQKGPALQLFKNKRMLFAAGLLLVLGATFLISSLVDRGDGNVEQFTKAAQAQTEIVRVADLVLAQNTISQETQNIAMNTLVTVRSDLNRVKTYMSDNGRTLNEKDLALSKNTAIDDQLGEANRAGNLDSAYATILKEQLATYKTNLTEAYQVTSGPNGQELLGNAYDNAELLLRQLK